VPSTKVRTLAAMLKAIHASEDVAAAREKALQVIAKLRALRLTTAAELAATTFEETLSFPEEHWRRIRTKNPLERVPRGIRQRTRVVGAFPDGQSALNPGRGTLAAHRRDRLVAQTILERRAAEGPADERSRHSLSQRRAPLSPI
jgi:transposase-like protein